MLNLLYSLLLNQENKYAPSYTKIEYPGYLDNIRPILLLEESHSVIKCIQLCFATELKIYLSRSLQRSTINIDSGNNLNLETYPLLRIESSLKNESLHKFKSKSYNNLENSIVDNLYFVFDTHFSPIYTVSSFLILWSLNAECEYSK